MSKQLIPAQRHERIRNRLEANKVVSNAELCELLGISEATDPARSGMAGRSKASSNARTAARSSANG